MSIRIPYLPQVYGNLSFLPYVLKFEYVNFTACVSVSKNSVENSADPDQTPHSAASELGLQMFALVCLSEYLK